MAITPPRLQSMLSTPTTMNNFIALQSAQLAVATASVAMTFTNIPSTQRVSFKIANTGSNVAYISGSKSTGTPGVVPAIVSTATPQPASGTFAVSTCDAIPNGSIHTLDFIAGTDTISAICATAKTTTLEISIGEGQ